MDVLLPAFQSDSGLTVHTHLVGSGRALVMLSAKQADVALTHAPDAEASALTEHPDWLYRKLMFNDFVVVGPPADPSVISSAKDAAEAFRRIAETDAAFISRGDGSGTEEREKAMWKIAGATPQKGRLVTAGAGMGATLRIADQMRAYTLSDRATFAQNAGTLASRIVFEGDPRLLNTYAVIHARGSRAATFSEWLTRGRGRTVIAAYRIAGHPAFTVWPADRPDRAPLDVPR